MSRSNLLAGQIDVQSRTRIVFGDGAVHRLGEFAQQLGGGAALLVTDRGIRAAGHVEVACELLDAAGVAVTVFEDVHENPTTRHEDACVEVARAAEVELIIGLGGGSSLDTAKGCNFILTNGGQMADYWGIGKASKPMLPLIAVPTTAGTGSECQSFALIADEKTHQKMACGDVKAAAAVAVLDPALTVTQPRHVAACTGVDAITHAVESFVSTKRNAWSTMLAGQSLGLTIGQLGRVLDDGEDREARGAMLLGAAMAGTAIENSMLGAAHAAANPLTARFDVVHGQAVGLMLPHVIRFNATDGEVAGWYADLARDVGVAEGGGDDVAAAFVLAERIEGVVREAGLATRLGELEIGGEHAGELADEAAEQWTGRFNPRAVGREEFVRLFEAAV